MRCPKCGNRDDKVIDSRQSRDSSSIRRRRVCLACAFRFTTYEEIERTDLRVIKRDRRHEVFDRRKLANSIAKACEKRSISLMTLEQTVDDIVHEIETSGREVTSAAMGDKVLAKLRELDEVAYLRYASVHRHFEDVDQFVDEIQALGRRIKPNALQPELFNEPANQWSRLKKNFPTSAPNPDSFLSSIAIGCMPRSRRRRIAPVTRAGG